MNSISKYKHFEKFVLRTPYLPFNEISNLTTNKIKELCKSPAISQAIYLASPDLHSEMIKFIENSDENSDEKLVYTLLKYLTRMGTRCTPFGLFAGCSIGHLSNILQILN